MGNLEYATQLIRQKRGEYLEKLLPGPLPGWKAMEPETKVVAAAIFGGGVSAKRGYKKNYSYISVEILADSPLLQSIVALLNNPIMAMADGGKMEKIKGQRTITKYDHQAMEGTISIVVANRYVVIVEGRSVTKKEMTEYATSIDFNKLSGI